MIDVDISFVILTWNSSDFIERCVGSIKRMIRHYKEKYSYEIIIVDNRSTDGTITILKQLERQYKPFVNSILLDKNCGTTFPRNLAVKRSFGKFICILDSDVEIKTRGVEKMIQFLEANRMVGLVVPRVFYPSGAIQKSTDQFPTLFRKIIRYLFLKKIELSESINQQLNPVNEPFEVEYAISAFWMIPRNVWETVGYLDEKIFYSPEDVDYCIRIRKAGYKIFMVPDSKIVHHAQEISRGIKFNRAFFEHVKGLLYYFHKHKYLWAVPRRLQ